MVSTNLHPVGENMQAGGLIYVVNVNMKCKYLCASVACYGLVPNPGMIQQCARNILTGAGTAGYNSCILAVLASQLHSPWFKRCTMDFLHLSSACLEKEILPSRKTW